MAQGFVAAQCQYYGIPGTVFIGRITQYYISLEAKAVVGDWLWTRDFAARAGDRNSRFICMFMRLCGCMDSAES